MFFDGMEEMDETRTRHLNTHRSLKNNSDSRTIKYGPNEDFSDSSSSFIEETSSNTGFEIENDLPKEQKENIYLDPKKTTQIV